MNPAKVHQRIIRILALDPSLSCVGWALMEFDPELVRDWVNSHGNFRPEGDDLDAKLANAADTLGRMLMASPVDILAIELPVVYRNPATTIKLGQLVGALRYVAYQTTDRTIEIQPGGRLTALGLPCRMKRKTAKELVVSMINTRYKLELEAADHDVADAVAVGHAAILKLRQEAWGRGDKND